MAEVQLTQCPHCKGHAKDYTCWLCANRGKIPQCIIDSIDSHKLRWERMVKFRAEIVAMLEKCDEPGLTNLRDRATELTRSELG